MKKWEKGIVLILSFLVLFVPVSAVGATCKKGDANINTFANCQSLLNDYYCVNDKSFRRTKWTF